MSETPSVSHTLPNDSFWLTPKEWYLLNSRGRRWREFLFDEWYESLTRADQLSLHLIPLRKLTKRPLQANWTDERLTFKSALSFALGGYNIGVVLHERCVIDIDQRDFLLCDKVLDDLRNDLGMRNYLLSATPRGFNIWLSFIPPHEYLLKLREKYGIDVPRSGDMYVLLPPSITCEIRTCQGQKDKSHEHKLIVRRWVKW